MPTFDAVAPKITVKVERGDTWRVPIFVKVNGDALDLSEYTFAAQIRTEPDAEAFTSIDIDTSDAENGNLLLTVEPEVTEDYEPGSYAWDLQATHAVTGVRTWARGPWIVYVDVTRGA